MNHVFVCLIKNILPTAEFLQKSKEVQAILLYADGVHLLA
jgi:hypothetical protein